LQTPWQFLKRVAVAKPNHQAVFGIACRDFAIQLRQGAPQTGGEGTSEEQRLRKTTVPGIERIDPAELPALIRRLRRVFRNLQFVPARRSQNDPKPHMLDMRRSILRSLRYGGEWTPLAFRRKKLRQPHLIVMCDVSASMIQHAGFTMPLLFALSHSTAKIDAFVCAGDLEPVTNYFKQTEDYYAAVDKVLADTMQVGRGTQLARSFQHLAQQAKFRLTSASCLLVVSDAETIEPSECSKALKQVAARVRKVFWLNPQRREQWNNEIIRDLCRYCDMEVCTSLNQTIRFLNRL
jgi:uncharacterized protein with von Willebrand factor type A (vWA) domain